MKFEDIRLSSVDMGKVGVLLSAEFGRKRRVVKGLAGARYKPAPLS